MNDDQSNHSPSQRVGTSPLNQYPSQHTINQNDNQREDSHFYNDFQSPFHKQRSKTFSGSRTKLVQGPLYGWKYYRRKICQIIESIEWTIFMAIITIYALFGDDIRVLVTDKDGDPGFWIVTLICMSLFAIEMVLASLSQDDYFLGFFFWLDFLSTISMLLDVGWISNAIFNGGTSAVSAVKLARAGRASRVGTRAGRIVRVVRLIRLSKLYKAAKQQLEREAEKLLEQDEAQQNLIQQQQLESNPFQQEKSKDQSPRMIEPVSNNNSNVLASEPNNNNESNIVRGPRTSTAYQRRQTRRIQKTTMLKTKMIPGGKGSGGSTLLRKQSLGDQNQGGSNEILETNLGKQLTELTNKRVITIVMLILFSVPIFNLNTYQEEAQSYDTGLQDILYWKNDSTVYTPMLSDYIDYHTNLRILIVYLSIDDVVQYPKDNPDYYKTIRDESLSFYSVDNPSLGTAVVVSNTSADDELNAILSISRTIFVSIVLSIAAILFAQDVQHLVLTPLEKMLVTVKKISENPLQAAAEEENQAFIQMQQGTNNQQEELDDEKLETVVLQKLIVKIGALLALGFGEAGSQIIAKNMGDADHSVNPMLPGKKVMAIFGFCDIRNFTDATEVLQQEVMVFVNEIAEIVHGIVDQFSGSANKNIGDAFLLVWKFNDSDYQADSEGNLHLKPLDHISQIADMSVLSFVTIITNVAMSPKLAKYKTHSGLNKRIPNYSVKMGFGLHLGWAIEGAIGSEYKIDASYLSPNVNMASRLEAATKQFGSFMLISGALRDVCTKETQKNMRHIDRVTVKGSIEPMDIYTVDVSLEVANRRISKRASMIYDKAGQNPKPIDENTKKKNKVLRRMKRDKLKQQVMKHQVRIADKWNNDNNIKWARQPFTEEFYSLWEAGFEHYIKGDWDKAKAVFEKTVTYLPNQRDGPSNTLLRVITEEPFLKNNWKGYRELTEK